MNELHGQLTVRLASKDPGAVKPICIAGSNEKDGTEIALYVIDGRIVGGFVTAGDQVVAEWGLTP